MKPRTHAVCVSMGIDLDLSVRRTVWEQTESSPRHEEVKVTADRGQATISDHLSFADFSVEVTEEELQMLSDLYERVSEEGKK